MVTCERVREALSAQLDGEDSQLRPVSIDEHLGACADCRAFAAGAGVLHRVVRVAPAAAVPDRTAELVAAIEATAPPARPATAHRAERSALAAVGVVQLLIAVPTLFLGDAVGASDHLAREVGAFAVALGVGFVVAAWQPARAAGLLPMAAVLVACLLAVVGVDLAAGRTDLLAESPHLVEVFGVALLWSVVRARRGSRPARRPVAVA